VAHISLDDLSLITHPPTPTSYILSLHDALPIMTVRKPNCQISVWSLEMQGTISLAVKETGAGAKCCIVCRPGPDRIVGINARSRKNRVGQLAGRDVRRFVRKHELRPCRIGIRDNVPVDIEAGDLFKCRLIGL